MKGKEIRKLVEYFAETARKIDPVFTQQLFIPWLKEQDDKYWPDWCFAPLALEKIYLKMKGQAQRKEYTELDVDILGCYSRWSQHKIVLDADTEFIVALLNTKSEKNISILSFYELPYTCPLIILPAEVQEIWEIPVTAFCVLLDCEIIESEKNALHFLLFLENGEFVNIILSWNQGKITDNYYELIPNNKFSKINHDVIAQEFEEMIKGLLTITLYICSAETDIKPRPEHPNKRLNRISKNYKRGANVYDLGFRFGESYRRFMQSQKSQSSNQINLDTQQRRIPHVRKAHWHSYWVGPLTDKAKRKKVLKWLPPMLIGAETMEDEPVTIKRII